MARGVPKSKPAKSGRGQGQTAAQKKKQAAKAASLQPPLPPPPRAAASSSGDAAHAAAEDTAEEFFGLLLAGDQDSAASSSFARAERKLGRRDTEDAVDRALNGRLVPHYGKAIVEGAVNKKGERMWDVVAAQVRHNRAGSGKLSTKFWSKLIGEFNLEVGLCCRSSSRPTRGKRRAIRRAHGEARLRACRQPSRPSHRAT